MRIFVWIQKTLQWNAAVKYALRTLLKHLKKKPWKQSKPDTLVQFQKQYCYSTLKITVQGIIKEIKVYSSPSAPPPSDSGSVKNKPLQTLFQRGRKRSNPFVSQIWTDIRKEIFHFSKNEGKKITGCSTCKERKLELMTWNRKRRAQEIKSMRHRNFYFKRNKEKINLGDFESRNECLNLIFPVELERLILTNKLFPHSFTFGNWTHVIRRMIALCELSNTAFQK